jgi:hypothetical protein
MSWTRAPGLPDATTFAGSTAFAFVASKPAPAVAATVEAAASHLRREMEFGSWVFMVECPDSESIRTTWAVNVCSGAFLKPMPHHPLSHRIQFLLRLVPAIAIALAADVFAAGAIRPRRLDETFGVRARDFH